MYRSEFLGTLIVALSLAMGSSVGAAQASKKGGDVFAEFQKKVSSLETELKKEKDVVKRYDLFLKNYQELSDLRAKSPRQAETKEINMSLFMDTLAFLPEKKDFQSGKCPEYKKEVNNMMKAYAKDQKEPFVERAFGVVELICK